MIEFHLSGKRSVEHFAAIWLNDLVDNEDTDLDLPVWKCNHGVRLSQNYITEKNFKSIPDIDIEEVGRIRFRARFKAGTDRDHYRFVSDNDSRETIESWEACFAEGVRQEEVTKDLPPSIEKLHEESLTHGRDVLAMASEEDKKRWLAKDGTSWTGAFGQDPAELVRSRRYKDDHESDYQYESDDSSHDAGSSGVGSAGGNTTDLGISDATTDPTNAEDEDSAGRPSDVTGNSLISTTSNTSNKSGSSKNPVKAYKDYRDKKRDLHRNHRGLMQWRPLRNVQFAKDETTFAIRRVTKLGSLSGRQPDVESEV